MVRDCLRGAYRRLSQPVEAASAWPERRPAAAEAGSLPDEDFMLAAGLLVERGARAFSAITRTFYSET
jgi:hypothetical protein